MVDFLMLGLQFCLITGFAVSIDLATDWEAVDAVLIEKTMCEPSFEVVLFVIVDDFDW